MSAFGIQDRRLRNGLRPRSDPSSIAAIVAALRPQDVFATILQPANTMQAAINALPFSPDLLIDKDRVAATDWSWRDSATGLTNTLASNTTAAQTVFAGYSGTNNRVVQALKQAPKFFRVGTFTHTAGTADTIDLSTLSVIGQVTIKHRDAADDWGVWHRSLTTGNNLFLNLTAAQSTTNAYISVSGTVVTFSAAAPSGTYTYKALAHDPDTTNGIIQCGSFTTDASGNSAVTLGWQPQFVILKPVSNGGSWLVFDTSRGWGAGADKFLLTNTSSAESSSDFGAPTASGFNAAALIPSVAYIYWVMRAPV